MNSLRSVTLRPVLRGDLPLILSLLGDVERAHLWGQRRVGDEEQLLETWRAWSRDRVGAKFMVERRGRPLGLVFDYERSLEDGHTKIVTLLRADEPTHGAGVLATALFAQWLFQNLPLRKVCFDVFGFNGQVVRMLSRLEVKQEMQRREHRYWNGRYWDQFGFALGREECAKIVARFAAQRTPRARRVETPLEHDRDALRDLADSFWQTAAPSAPSARDYDAVLASLVG
jgi:RimJ/RimL family protein N-acetyltransferase